MKKDRVNARLRAYVREHLTPTLSERQFVSRVYASVGDVLGTGNCLQIGSFPRYTAITPLHDLDILYVIGGWSEDADPTGCLTELEATLKRDYVNPTDFPLEISKQSHSITISYKERENEIFAVDIVPAYIEGTNEFSDDTYMVPELATKSHAERRQFVEASERLGHAIGWLRTDPRGYISVATNLNALNEDFRRTVKLVKGWKTSCKEQDENFPLKSFHLEQILTQLFENNIGADIFDAVFNFFCDLPNYLERPKIPDRADPDRYIDEYIANLDSFQKDKILEARDYFLIQLEAISDDTDISDLLVVGYRKRASASEKYLFDFRIPVFSEQEFNIVAQVQERNGGFRAKLLDKLGIIDVDRKIDFTLGKDAPDADLFKWKVKNDDSTEQPRGEITDHRTRNVPEHSKYRGEHYVECFAIKNGICIGKAKQNVVLQR